VAATCGALKCNIPSGTKATGSSLCPSAAIAKVGSAEPQGSIDKSEGFHELYFPVLRKSYWYAVRNLYIGNLGEKSVYAYLAVVAGVPCPLKITVQCSTEKKFGNHWLSALARRRSISNGGDAVPNVVGSERASACGNPLNRRPGFAWVRKERGFLKREKREWCSSAVVATCGALKYNTPVAQSYWELP